MPETAPLVIESPFRVLADTLGEGVALYREGLKAHENWLGSVYARLQSFDNRIKALTGTPAQVAAQTKTILAEREAAYRGIIATETPPPDPNKDPRITDEDRRIYHTLVMNLLDTFQADLANMVNIVEKFEVIETETSDELLATIEREVERKEALDRKAERERRRAAEKSKILSIMGQAVGGVLSAIPTGLTQVIGGVVGALTAAGSAVWDVDTARRFAHAIRNNANWLVYEQPILLDRVDKAYWNLDYIVGLLGIAQPTLSSIELRRKITQVKLDTGVWDEKELAAKKRTAGLVKWVVLGTALVGGVVWALGRRNK